MDSEQALLDALRRGEKAAFAQLFEANADRIYHLALKLLSDEQQADGIVQETFLTAIDKMDRFDGRSRLSSWLYRIAYNAAMDRLRARQPVAFAEDFDEEEDIPAPVVIADWANLPEEALTRAETAAQLDEAIDRLAPTLRATFILRDVEELSTSETAEVLGISEAAVKVRLHRARLALRETLSEYFTGQMTLD
jgi:RNA polymerase sigma-70 factor (ECF subfamily)